MAEQQLDFFRYLIPKDKEDYSSVYEFLTSLPIFYYGNNNPDVIELDREFIYQKNHYKVNVKKTRLSKTDDTFMGVIEQDVLDTLLYMATQEKTTRIVENGRIKILVSINEIYTQLKKKVRYENIKKAIQRLKETQISIQPLDPSKSNIKWHTESIISQYLIEDERYTAGKDPKTFIEFNTAFTKELLSGKIKLINFPKYIQLKNPISKYIYKKLVLSDMFSSSNYDLFYHNKSLFTFLLNCGYQTDTTMSKNNTIRAYKQALKELEENDLLNCDKSKMTAIKQGNKVVDYYIELTPSKWLVDENHKQNKVKRFKKDYHKETPSITYDYFSSADYYRDRHNRRHRNGG